MLVTSAGSECVGHYKALSDDTRVPFKARFGSGRVDVLLVCEAVTDGEELLRRESILRDVAGAAAD